MNKKLGFRLKDFLLSIVNYQLTTFLLIFFVLGLTSLIPTVAYAAVTVATNNNTNGTAYNSGRRMVRDTSGNIHLVYYSSSAEISYVKSSDNGVNWSIPQNISNPSDSSSTPSIAIDSNNNLHVVWVDYNYTVGNYEIYYSKYTTSWSTPVNISNNSGESSRPSIAIDSNNNLYVVWDDNTPGNKEIYYSKFTTSWSTPVNISNTSVGSYIPSIAIDSNNYLHVVWFEDAPQQIYYSKYTTSWSSPQNISNTSNDSSDPSIAIDSNNYLHVVWVDKAPGNLEIYYSKFTTSWSTPQNISNNSGDSEHPSIAIDSNNNLYVVWRDKISGNPEIYYSKFTASWSTPVNLSNTTANSIYPNLAYKVGTQGADLVWTEGDAAPYKVMYQLIDTTPPSTPTNLLSIAKDSAVELKWTANTEPDLAGYNIYRSTSAGGSYGKINTSLITSTSYTDASVSNGTIYYYKITAVDTSNNESGYSEYTIAKPGIYPSPASGVAKIVFNSDRDGGHEIYTMSADGSNQIRLTNNGTVDGGPSFSPDGTKIAFYSNRDGYNVWEIYIMNADGTAQTRLTNDDTVDGSPSFSPDGTKIAYGKGNYPNYEEIYIMNADGTGQTRLTNNDTADRSPSFSPDGTKIAFESWRDGNGEEIYIMNIDGTNQTRLTYNNSVDYIPSFSPDGTKIAFVSDRDGNYEIYIMNTDGTGQTRLTNNSASDVSPSFSPDGTKIAFVSDRDGNDEIYMMNIDGTNQTRLTNNSANDHEPSFSGAVFETTPPSVSVSDSPDPFTPEGDTVTDTVTFTLSATDLSGIKDWNLKIYSDSAKTNLVKTFSGTGSPTNQTWDAKDNNGKQVLNGTYYYVFTATDNANNTASTPDATVMVDAKAMRGNASDVTAIPSARKMVRDAMGNIHLVYYSGGEIYYTKSTDNGVNWSSPLNIGNNSGTSAYPAIAIDSNNYLHVVWNDNTLGNSEIYYSKYTTSWSTPQNISNNSGKCGIPSIAIDSNNYLHVVWEDNTPGNWEIYYSKYTTSWSTPVNISNNIGTSSSPSIAIDSNNYLHVVWFDSKSGSWEIYYSKYITSWSTPVNISNNSGFSSRPCIVIDSNNYLHVVWEDNTPGNYEILYSKYTTSWSTPVNISNNIGISSSPSIAIDSNNYLYVVWQDTTSGNSEIYYSKYTTSWSTPSNVSNTIANSKCQNLAHKVISSGVDLVWTEGNSAPYEIKYMNIETIPPSAPTGFTVTDPQTGGQLNLEWTANTESDLTGYNIYSSSTETGTYTKINTSLVLKPTTNYTDTGLTNGTTYWYKTTAVDNFGNESAYSTAKSGIPTSGGGDTQAPTITHTSVTSAVAGNNIIISATITDNVSVAGATLYYRITGTTTWTSITMNKSGDTYTATIPASDVTTSGVQYYIQAQDAKPNIARNPNTAPSTPYSITVTAGVDNEPPVINHTSVTSATANSDIIISATITDNVSVSSATLCYRKTGTTTFTTLTMNKSGDNYTATIPSSVVTTSGIYYYIEASDARPNITRSPNTAPSTPYFINVTIEDNTPPVIKHTNVEISKSNVDINITCEVTDDVGVANVTLYYKRSSDSNFTSLSMTKSGDTYTATIPAGVVTTSGVDYYISASDAIPNIARSPNTAPSTPYQIVIDDTYPNASISNLITDQIVGGTFTILGNANDNNFKEYLVEYGAGASPTVWKEIFKGSSNVNNGQLAIWDTSMLSGTYTIRITATDKAGNTQKAQVAVKVYNVIILPKQLPQAKKWGMMAVLLNPVNSSTDSVFNISGAKVYRWDPTIPDAQQDDKFKKYKKPTTIKPGEGYWVMTDTGGNIAVQGSLVDQTRNIEVHIYPNWNQISSPFNFAVKWSDVKVRYLGVEKSVSDAAIAGWIREYLYWDGQGYLNSQTNPNAVLESWVSYWVKANYECDLIIPPIESATPKLKEIISYPDGSILKISANAGEYRDTYNFIGIKENASDEYDIYDVDKPPSISPSLEVFFPHPNTKERYSSDFRKDNLEWEMSVKSNELQDTEVNLEFEKIKDIPGYYLEITDEVSGYKIDLRKEKNYRYKPGADGLRKFKIELIKEGETEEQETTSISCYAYPNPYSGKATGISSSKQKYTSDGITFRYKTGGNIQNVVIEIFNIKGKLLDKFFGELDGDTVWTKVNSIANGVYIYRITVSDGVKKVSKTGKIAIIK